MDAEKLQELGMWLGNRFLPDFDALTTSDLQGCIEAELQGRGLTLAEQNVAEEIALQYIYEKVKQRG